MAEPKEKEAKLQVKFEDIKFNEEGKTKAILACIPLIGLILLFVEKDDQFVRYYGAQYTVLGLAMFVVSFVLGIIPFLGWCVVPILWLAMLVAIVMGMVKANSGEKFQIPMLYEYAIKLMNAV